MKPRKLLKYSFWDRVKLAIFRRIVAGQIRQGYHHHEKLARLYAIIAEESKREFWEDNLATQYYFLTECSELGFSDAWESTVNQKMRKSWVAMAPKLIK